jgi:peptidoglycan/xylan/chitin deacetylase (PgdA/CDA1 family)
VILTFDDSRDSQITEGLPDLVARGMTATFFLMTVVFGNEGWMSERDVKHLADEGMTVAGHTWDHHRVDRYSGSDWKIQLDQPKALLEKLIGRPVEHFAYPYGLWNRRDSPTWRRQVIARRSSSGSSRWTPRNRCIRCDGSSPYRRGPVLSCSPPSPNVADERRVMRSVR